MAGWGVILNPTSDPLRTNVAQLDISNGAATGIGYRLLAPAEFPPPKTNPIHASSFSTEGAVATDVAHYDNREINLQVRVTGSSAADLESKLGALYQMLGQINRKGGSLKLTSPNSTVVYFDLTPEAEGGCQFTSGYVARNRAVVSLRLAARPFWRAAEIDLGSNSETTLPWLVFTDTGVKGDVPALGRLVVTDSAGADQWTVIVGVQSEYYSNAATEALAYQAEDFTVLSTSTKVAGAAGASGAGSNVIRNTDLTTTLQALLKSEIDASNLALTHKGDFRIWARLYRPTGNTGAVTVRLEWAEGDYHNPALNDPVAYAANDREGVFTWANLGTVHISPDSDRWEFRLLASSTIPGDEIDVDCFLLFPTTEGYIELSGLLNLAVPSLLSARDEFNQAAGALNGKTLPAGGTWAGAGDPDDFALNTTDKTARRTATADASAPTGGRYALAGVTTYSSILVECDIKPDQDYTAVRGIVARYVDATNWLMLIEQTQGLGQKEFQVRTCIGGAVSVLQFTQLTPTRPGNFWTFRLYVDARGGYTAWAGLTGSTQLQKLFSGWNSTLATGGTLATGQVGIYDAYTGASAMNRDYDNFRAWVPTADAAIFASQSLELRHDRARREDTAGTFNVNVSVRRGRYLTIPAAGQEARTVRLLVKGFRNDPYTQPDPAIDDISAQLFYTPRGLVVPEA